MTPIDRFKEYLIDNAESISQEIVDYNLGKLEIELPAEIIERSIKTNSDFIMFLGESLNEPDDKVAIKFTKWHKEEYRQTDSEIDLKKISSLIKPYAESRLQLVRMISGRAISQGLSTEEVIMVISRISFLLDLSISEIILERERLAYEMNQRHLEIITELSSPVVPIQNGIAVLPLIGELNSRRSDHIVNKVIPKVCDLKIEYLIIDFSGMVSIDNEVGSQILNIYKVFEILGVNIIFTGIRPDLSKKIVDSGINFSSLKTFGTVQQAIHSIT